MKRFTIGAAAALLLSACSMGQDVESPEAALDLPDVGGTSTIYYDNSSITTTAPDITNSVILKTSPKVNAGSSTAQDYVAV